MESNKSNTDDHSKNETFVNCCCFNCRSGINNRKFVGHICHKENCTQIFTLIQELQEHLICHNKRPFLCTWPNCDRSFAFNEVLRLHLSIHTNDVSQNKETPVWDTLFTIKQEIVDLSHDESELCISDDQNLGTDLLQELSTNVRIEAQDKYIENPTTKPVSEFKTPLFECTRKDCLKTFATLKMLKQHHKESHCKRSKRRYTRKKKQKSLIRSEGNCVLNVGSAYQTKPIKVELACDKSKSSTPDKTYRHKSKTSDQLAMHNQKCDILFDLNHDTKASELTKTPTNQIQIKANEINESNYISHSNRVKNICPCSNCANDAFDLIDVKQHICDFDGCGKLFPTPLNLNIHLRVHKGERPFICDLENCKKTFSRRSTLNYHRFSLHPNKTNVNAANESCLSDKLHNLNKSIYTKSCECNRNTNQVHSSGLQNIMSHSDEPVFKCGWKNCTEDFVSAKKLRMHYKNHIDKRELDKCSSNYRRSRVYSYLCICSICINDNHNPEVKKQHICDFDGCGKLFSAPSLLYRHATVHTRHRPFVCGFDSCDKAYSQIFALKFHRHRTGHFRNGLCIKCEKPSLN